MTGVHNADCESYRTVGPSSHFVQLVSVFHPGLVHFRFIVNKLILVQGVLRVFELSPVMIILPMRRTRSSTWYTYQKEKRTELTEPVKSIALLLIGGIVDTSRHNFKIIPPPPEYRGIIGQNKT